MALILLENFKNIYFSFEFEVALETWLGDSLEACLMIPCLFLDLLVFSDVFSLNLECIMNLTLFTWAKSGRGKPHKGAGFPVVDMPA